MVKSRLTKDLEFPVMKTRTRSEAREYLKTIFTNTKSTRYRIVKRPDKDGKVWSILSRNR